jgi:hypothetical protein
MIANSARERRSKLRMQEERAAISAKGVAARRGETTEEVNVSSSVVSQPQKPRTREAVARENKIPERKLRAAAEVKKATRST